MRGRDTVAAARRLLQRNSRLAHQLAPQREIVAVDGIEVGDLEYVDIGRPMGTSEVLPVTVKSLLFPAEHKD